MACAAGSVVCIRAQQFACGGRYVASGAWRILVVGDRFCSRCLMSGGACDDAWCVACV